MNVVPSTPPKPRTEEIRTEITRLPEITFGRRIARLLWRWVSILLVRLFTRPRAQGLENFPENGPALIVVNHLGDADAILGLAFFPKLIDTTAKADLYDFPVLGALMDAYGVIWLHRGQADRRALRACLQGLEEGRLIGIAPEGRESLTGGLEPGTQGAAYLAYRSGAPLVPVTFTGTRNVQILGNLRRLRRSDVSLTVGKPFDIPIRGDRKEILREGTELVMRTLAAQLPEEYRGVYGENREEG